MYWGIAIFLYIPSFIICDLGFGASGNVLKFNIREDHQDGVETGEKNFDEDNYYLYDESMMPRVIDLDAYDLDDDYKIYTMDEEYKSNSEKITQELVIPQNPHCPDLPQNYAEKGEELCQSVTCEFDQDCLTRDYSDGSDGKVGPQSFCCWNGCVKSCFLQKDPPKAFDWMDESDKHTETLNNNFNTKSLPNSIPPLKISSSSELEHGNTTGSIVLQGGCVISLKQLHDLQMFQIFSHVENCSCLDGEVVCEVNAKAPKADQDQPITSISSTEIE